MTLLFIMLIGFGLMLGIYSRQQAFRKLGRLLLLAALGSMFLSMGKNYFSQLPPFQQLIFGIMALGAILFIGLRILAGRAIFNRVMENIIYDGLKAIFLFPFRLIGMIFRKYK